MSICWLVIFDWFWKWLSPIEDEKFVVDERASWTKDIYYILVEKSEVAIFNWKDSLLVFVDFLKI